MKKYLSSLKFLLLIVLVGMLFGFTQQRNAARKLTNVNVSFLDENDPFITLNTVNKLLVQNNDSVTGIPKETLVLQEMESRLMANEMIREAEVYITVDGVLGAKIEQRNPIGRVAGTSSFYVDEDGKVMPLSSVYSARVPLITGTSETNFTELKPLLLEIQEDEFMKKSVVGIDVAKDGRVTLKLRKYDFDVRFGKVERIDLKFQNFKAFYQQTKRENTIGSYSTIDLQFGNQVVATKIE